MSDADADEMAAAQMRADSVAHLFGRATHPPLPDERPIAYRRRLANAYKALSPRWKNVELYSLNSESLANAEEDIYKDAQRAARDPQNVPPLTLREIRVPRAGGAGWMSEFVGDPNAWMISFKPAIRMQSTINDIGLKR